MEASAFLKLCEYTGVKSLGVIKGISDFGDIKKGEDPAAYEDALRNTGFALKEWCVHSIPAVNWQPDDGICSLVRLSAAGLTTGSRSGTRRRCYDRLLRQFRTHGLRCLLSRLASKAQRRCNGDCESQVSSVVTRAHESRYPMMRSAG